MLRFLTAGESHGPALLVIVDGLPAGLPIEAARIDEDLRARQAGHGRGRRMKIESDQVEILSGVRLGTTLGSPVALLLRNRDWSNWEHTMSRESEPPAAAGGARRSPVTRPRPGHADLAGMLKYGHADARAVLERASARETAARVAAGSVARQLLARFGVRIASHVVAIGGAALADRDVPFEAVEALPADTLVRCVDPRVSEAMVAAIDLARRDGDTLGGAFEVVARGVPPGLGSYVQWDRRLDARLGQAVLSIPSVKAVSIGDGWETASMRGSEAHDPIEPAAEGPSEARPWALARPSNHAGGIEGGVSNGEDIRVTARMKPIATLMSPLPSVDLATGEPADAAVERSDTCAVPAGSVIGQAVVSLVLADAFTEKFGQDSVAEIEDNYRAWRRRLGERFEAGRRHEQGAGR